MNLAKMRGPIVAPLLLLPLALGFPMQCGAESGIRSKVIVGYDLAEGDYGTGVESRTETVPLTLKLDASRWKAKLQVSQVTIERQPPDGEGDPSTQTGQGDTIIHLARKSAFRSRGYNYVDWGIKAKIPTASEEKGLGSGETDWMFQVDAFRKHGPWLPFATLGYRWRGDSPEVDREDGLYGSVGMHYQSPGNWQGGFLIDWRSASSVRLDDGSEGIPYLGFRFSSRISMLIYGLVGLNEGSADRGGGLQLVISPGSR